MPESLPEPVETGQVDEAVEKQTCVAVSQHSMPPETGPHAVWHSVSLVHFRDVHEVPPSLVPLPVSVVPDPVSPGSDVSPEE